MGSLSIAWEGRISGNRRYIAGREPVTDSRLLRFQPGFLGDSGGKCPVDAEKRLNSLPTSRNFPLSGMEHVSDEECYASRKIR